MGCDARPVPVDFLTLAAPGIMAHEGPPVQGTPLQVELEEVTPGEFIISVVWREKKLGSLYLRGDRDDAAAFLEAARERIVLAITGDAPNDVGGQVQRELVNLSRIMQQPGG
ncbi:hypothetical protein [Methylobacterium frigidaeris]|uniref:Uncharacterized protein n=1 Tax=Methylobacterium frigidaeris TaxID=2038277 RepID=A0AA37HA07_9HYPH|nr:hypothetical protein [Methylobacterium frigidaeris]PIK72385.1 hypothetical protein CS379_14250 [Methylobacterium frigidaeris]GJD61759.1 hypothetical protein MPEAHAMD_1906 [Methylobacterium frigidaeris]